ncbi:hypothetical protein EDD11_002091 [Mortierella claussenii]|nr:hypothetical protein EDD11_002091 [Mortierella claussenii]
MSRAHSYAQIPISETARGHINDPDNDDHQDSNHRQNLAIARSQKSASSSTRSSSSSNRNSNRVLKGIPADKDRREYATLNVNDRDDDEEDDFENAGEESVMLRPMGSISAVSGSGSGSAPRRSVYSTVKNGDSDDDDEYGNDNEISLAPSSSSSTAAEGSSSRMDAAGSSSVAATSSTAKRNSGARTTNRSFLARLTGRQRPERDAQRMVRSAVDGVFSNLSAKPRVEKPFEEELPPAYKTAAMDVSPAYHETMLPPGFTDEDDMLMVEGLPVGGLLGFMWNMIISMSFQFVGFFLTYLLHTSHATKEGSKTGLGITLISMGYKMMTGRYPDGTIDDGAVQVGEDDSDTGYMGNTGPSPSSGYYGSGSLKNVTDYEWLSYIMLILGMAVLVQSVSTFTRVKLSEIRVHLATNAAQFEEVVVSANAAAGASSPSIAAATSSAASTTGGPTAAGAGTGTPASRPGTFIVAMV